jgi:hypothetical protein
MRRISRRAMLATTGLGALSAGLPTAWAGNPGQSSAARENGAQSQKCSLPLTDYQPESMLHVQTTHVSRSRFSVIDFHTHVTNSARVVNGVAIGAARVYNGMPQDLLPTMDRTNVLAMVNLTGGFGDGLTDSVSHLDRSYAGRFYSMTEPSYDMFGRSDYPQVQAEAIAQAHRDGARGLKILKTLGLFLRENTTSGPLVKVDDPRFQSNVGDLWQSQSTCSHPCVGSGRILSSHRSPQ